MSRWWLVALACVACMLVWLMATWPLPPEQQATEDSADSEPAPVAHALPPADAPPPAAEPAAQPAPQEPSSPQPAAAEPSAAAEPAAEPEFFTRENGPVAEYKAQFEKEPRDSAANEAEQVVRGAFDPKDSPKPVFRAVLCRETICKIETRFSAENMGAYVAAMTRIVHGKFDSKLASERTSSGEAGEISVTVYAKRPPPAE